MSKKTFSFIHAADLHLGAPFKGLGQEAGWLKDTLSRASYEALDRLVLLCLKLRPHALLLAGDIYNSESSALQSLNSLKDAFIKLNEAGILVFVVHGNHDPEQGQPAWSWPANVKIFSAKKAESVLLYGTHDESGPISFTPGPQADPIAVVHGMSHLNAALTDNLAEKIVESAALLNKNNAENIFQIGLLHCAITGGGRNDSIALHKPYAPCSLEDLSAHNFDYWALGHIHKRSVVKVQPLAMYSGSMQGLHINESGSKGCLYVTLQKGVSPELVFYPLAPVEWDNIEFTVPENSNFSILEDELLENLHSLSMYTSSPARLAGVNGGRESWQGISQGEIGASDAEAGNRAFPPSFGALKGKIVRLVLKGRTSLNKELRAQEDIFLARLREKLAPELSPAKPFIWLKDIKVETRPLQDIEAARRRDDLLGEILRHLEAAKSDPLLKESLLKDVESPLRSLFASTNSRQIGLPAPSDEELNSLLDEAAFLCMELLSDYTLPLAAQTAFTKDGSKVS